MMLRGKWHFIALSALLSVIALQTKQLLLCIFLWLGWLGYLYVHKRMTRLVLVLSILGFVFFYYYFPTYESGTPTNELSFNEQTSWQGTISSAIKETDRSFSFTLREKESNDELLVTYFYPFSSSTAEAKETIPYTYRSQCYIRGQFELPDEATNPFEFNYRKYLFEQGMKGQIIVDSLEDIQCSNARSLLGAIYTIRDRLLQKAETTLHPELAAWQQALIFGNSEQLDESVELLFQRWGLSHLLAISGLHVGIIIAIFYVILLRIMAMTKEKARMLVLLFLPIYALLAGGQPSVWRASLMTVVVLLLGTKDIKVNRLDVLSIVFLGLIFVNKHIIYHVGFQFSFLVTLGLLLSTKWFQSSTSRVEMIFKISFIAQMMIVPLQMYYFYHFQPLSILLNVIIVPYFSLFVIPTMFFSFFLYFLPAALKVFVESVFLTIHTFVLRCIEVIDQYANTPFISGEITLPIAIVYYALLIVMMIQLEKNKRRLSFYTGFSLCCLLTYIIAAPYLSKTGSVTMLDIGQGDAYVIELPHRQAVFLVDAGATVDFETDEPRDTVYNSVIRPYLMGRGIQKIDNIFISHPHLDHHGSVRFILEDFAVDEIIIDAYYSPEETELQQWLTQGDVLITKAKAGDRIERKGHLFYALSPAKDTKDENDNSLVLYTKIGEKNWLFTGDISESIERRIVQSFKNLQVDMLKVAHHGSHTSTAEEMIEVLQPENAFIPVGEKNRYGHPTKEVIDLLKGHGINIFRTDEDGAVQYKYREGQEKILRFNDEN